MTNEPKPASEGGQCVRRAGDGFLRMGHLITAAVVTDMWCLIDWYELRRYTNDLLDAAIEDDYEGRPQEPNPEGGAK